MRVESWNYSPPAIDWLQYASDVNNPWNPLGGGRGVDPDEWTEGAEQRREERIQRRIAWVANGGWGPNLMAGAGALILLVIVGSIVWRIVG